MAWTCALHQAIQARYIRYVPTAHGAPPAFLDAPELSMLGFDAYHAFTTLACREPKPGQRRCSYKERNILALPRQQSGTQNSELPSLVQRMAMQRIGLDGVETTTRARA